MKSDVYLEGEASSPLYRRALVITVSGLCGVRLETEEDTGRVILAQGRTSVWHGACKLTCSFRREALRRCKFGHVRLVF
jgi:hypothetical protein